MSGILFLKTDNLDKLTQFYTERIGCSIWLKQPDCTLFQHGNFIFGFCRRGQIDSQGMLTFFFDQQEDVDRIYDELNDIATDKPAFNDKYGIYQFFAKDPEGRMLEFQWFADFATRFKSGSDLLMTRRSVRKYKPDIVADDTLEQLFELCRYAPTSRNSQSYYFRIIRQKELLQKLSEVRGKSSSSIANAPMAVAICSDPVLSKRHVQDGCIAAYHFVLSAWWLGLGTCWIAAMDREDVKDMLDIQQKDYVATVTPLGYPEKPFKEAPERKPADYFLR